MDLGDRSPASNDSILHDQAPPPANQPTKAPKQPTDRPLSRPPSRPLNFNLASPAPASTDQTGGCDGVVVAGPRTGFILWTAVHQRDCRWVTSQSTWLNKGLTMQPSHPVPDNDNSNSDSDSDSKPGRRHSTLRRPLSIGRLHALSVRTVQSIRVFSGSRARNSVLGELGLDSRFFCCGGQTASLLAEVGHGTHCEFGT